jgi:signal transduction histidine kinase
MKCLLDDLTGLLQLDHQTIEKQPVDLVTIASQVRDDLTAALQGKNGKIEFGNLPMAHGDASLLRVALQNLVGNAVKFVAKGTSPMVKISAHVESDTLRIDVHDNGIGMETEHIAKTFEIFKRLHTGKAYPGSGLGLSICRRIAELHGGKLSATSEPGVGSCFTLVLPILPPGNEPQRIGDEHL